MTDTEPQGPPPFNRPGRAPTPSRSDSRGRRRAQPAPSPVTAAARDVGQKTAIVAAATGMVLTVMLPTTAGATADGPQEALATSSISAATEARLTFERAGPTSKVDPDTKLKQVMVASGGKAKAHRQRDPLQPMDELIKTSPFGYRVSPITGSPENSHRGQDYGAPCGTPVAAASGTVVEAGFQVDGGGNRIVVDHGNGLETTYNHLCTIDGGGQPSARGEVLGESGTTGASTGCHLHFEVMVNGKLVDPTGWL